MAIKAINLSWIVVSDLDKAITFFQNNLGMQLKERHDQFGWAELEGPDGGSRLGLGRALPQSPIQPGDNAVVTFTVADIEKEKKVLSSKGTKLLGETIEIPGEVKMQLFCDDDGNKFQLVQLLSK